MRTVVQAIASKINALIAKEVALDASFCRGAISRPEYEVKNKKIINDSESLRAKARNYGVTS